MLIKGTRNRRSGTAIVFADGKRLTASRSLRIRRHSPTGFEWGYGGSGPAQLALAILLHAGLDPEWAQTCYQEFKREYIAILPHDGFTLELDVMAWAYRHGRS